MAVERNDVADHGKGAAPASRVPPNPAPVPVPASPSVSARFGAAAAGDVAEGWAGEPGMPSTPARRLVRAHLRQCRPFQPGPQHARHSPSLRCRAGLRACLLETTLPPRGRRVSRLGRDPETERTGYRPTIERVGDADADLLLRFRPSKLCGVGAIERPTVAPKSLLA